MTVVFTAVSSDWIIASADSAVTLDFSDRREYETGRKFWSIPGVGSLSTWGARDGNVIGRRLAEEWSDPSGRDVSQLADWVHKFLTEEFQPKENGLADVGFHVAGYMPGGSARLFHSYFEIPAEPARDSFYDFQDITVPVGTKQFLYNGRNDLAHVLISMLLTELRAGRATRFRLNTAADACFLSHFVLRIAGEITPEVGPPFVLSVQHPSGASVRMRFDSLDRVPLEDFERQLAPNGAV